eukprot:g937.t1
MALLKPVLTRGESFELTDGTFRKGDVEVSRKSSPGVQAEHLHLHEVLGRGAGSSHVQRAVDRRTGRSYALKVVNVYDRAQREQLIREIKSHVRHDCPTLVRYFGAFCREGTVSIALEYMDCGSLDRLAARAGAVPERVLAAMTYQVVWGLSYLRYEREFHRDVKPQNVLVNRRGEVKLADFGISRSFEDTLSMAQTFVGTVRYMSPERVSNQAYNFKADIWSLGVLLIELATSRFPYHEAGGSHLQLACAIVDMPEPALPAAGALGPFSPAFRQFVSLCVRKCADDRLPPNLLLNSPWFAEALGVRTADGGAVSLAACHGVVAEWLRDVDEGLRARQPPRQESLHK